MTIGKNIKCNSETKESDNLKGIDGWLLFVLLGLVLNVSKLPFILINLFVYHSDFINSLIFVIVTGFINLLLSIFLLIVMIKQIYFFPKLYFFFLIFISCLALLTYFYYFSNFDIQMLAYVPSVIIWLIYMKKSKRVRYTFIYNCKGEIAKKS